MSEKWSGWTPILKAADATRSIAFYCEILGFTKDWEHRFQEGWPLYVSVSRGSLTLHLSEHEGDQAGQTSLFVRVTDVDAVYAEFVSKGLVTETPPKDQEYGVREFHFRDPDGHLLRFGERLANYDETRTP